MLLFLVPISLQSDQHRALDLRHAPFFVFFGEMDIR